MPRTNSWLCIYALAQISKPYWYGTAGQLSSVDLYKNVVKPAILRDIGSSGLYTNYNSQLNIKVHDCSGLIVGALTCDTVNGEPSGKSPVAHGATSQFSADCKTKSNSMKDFPKLPGTLVFHSEGKTKSHVGIYVGEYVDTAGKSYSNVVVEAKGHKWGVTTSQISDSKWDSWGQLSCCTIDTTVGMKFDVRADATYAAANIQSLIDAKNMRPFVATVLSGSPNLDYDKIKEARISAMMFFGGELYDVSHRKQSSYMNPHLPKLIQDCNNSGMMYALWVNVRARTVIEADEECRTLYYVVSQFPPTLGLWLSLQSNQTQQINDNILEVYYKYIEKWGLKWKCGLYVTESQLNSISWNNFKDRFYLWQIAPMDVNDVDDELLQPEMFEVPD